MSVIAPSPVPTYKNLSAEHQTAIHNLANGYGEHDPQQFIDDMYRFGTQELIEDIIND